MNFFQEFRKETKIVLVVALTAVVLTAAGILLLQAGLGPSSHTPATSPPPQTAPSPQPQALDTSGWQSYEGAYPISFLYPEDLRVSEGDTDFGSIMRLWSPSRKDGDTEFQFFIQYQSSLAEVVQKLEQRGFERKGELNIADFQAIELRGIGTPHISIPPNTATIVVVQVDEQVYTITSWRAEEHEEIFQQILSTFRFADR